MAKKSETNENLRSAWKAPIEPEIIRDALRLYDEVVLGMMKTEGENIHIAFPTLQA